VLAGWSVSWSRCWSSSRFARILSERATTVYGVSETAPARSSRFMNPFAVGYTGETVQDHRATCECCRIEFIFRAPESQKHHRKRCDHCADHELEGTTDQQLAAFGEHHNRYPAVVAKAREMAREAMSAKGRAEHELENGRRRVAAALRTRDRHKGIHEAMVAQHVPTEDGKCLCGQRFPCPTWDAAKTARERFGDPEEPF
jgi:hypothetical protein